MTASGGFLFISLFCVLFGTEDISKEIPHENPIFKCSKRNFFGGKVGSGGELESSKVRHLLGNVERSQQH